MLVSSEPAVFFVPQAGNTLPATCCSVRRSGCIARRIPVPRASVCSHPQTATCRFSTLSELHIFTTCSQHHVFPRRVFCVCIFSAVRRRMRSVSVTVAKRGRLLVQPVYRQFRGFCLHSTPSPEKSHPECNARRRHERSSNVNSDRSTEFTERTF